MRYKRKEKRGFLKGVLLAFILGALIIVCGGALVGIGIKTWADNDFYSFASDIVGTVHTNYPEIEESVINSLKNRECSYAKRGNDILYKSGYSKEALKKRQVGRSVTVGIFALIFVALIVVALLFWQCIPHIKKEYILNIQVLIWVGIAIGVILLSGIKIGGILSDWSTSRYYRFVGEVTENLANEDRQKNQEAEKFVKAVLKLEHTNYGYSVLKEYGYDYRDFEYRDRLDFILGGMMAVTPLAVYFIIFYLCMQKRIINMCNSNAHMVK